MSNQAKAVKETKTAVELVNLQEDLSGFEITLRSKKAGREEVLALDSLPASSVRAIIRYGAMRFINDKLGGMDETETKEAFDRILGQLKEGWTDQRGQGGGSASQTIDPIVKEMEAMAWNRIKAALKNKGIPLKAIEPSKKKQLIGDLVSKHERELRPQAEAIVEARGKTLDLGSLDDLDL